MQCPKLERAPASSKDNKPHVSMRLIGCPIPDKNQDMCSMQTHSNQRTAVYGNPSVMTPIRSMLLLVSQLSSLCGPLPSGMRDVHEGIFTREINPNILRGPVRRSYSYGRPAS